MKKSTLFFRIISILCLMTICQLTLPSSADAKIITDMQLNEGGFVSYDHFKAELYLNGLMEFVPDAQIFGILEVYGLFYFWPDFTEEVNASVMDIRAGVTRVTFLEFDFENIDEFLPFGPLNFWGAWYKDAENYGYDVEEFWLDNAHKWTPTPSWTPPPFVTKTPTSLVTYTPTPNPDPGDIVSIDPIVGEMRFVPNTDLDGFEQGSPAWEPCATEFDYPGFTHVLTRNIAVMTTEVSRQMWAELKYHMSSLPDDPSEQAFSPSYSHPVQNIKWFQAILFANMLSQQNGLQVCYFIDPGFTTPIDLTNYESGQYYCNFAATGYRLPSEGEWEYFCRAGTTGPFSCNEPNYTTATCGDPTCVYGEFQVLEQYAFFCANNSGEKSEVVGVRMANPWNLKNLHGNVIEWCWDWWSIDYPTNTQSNYTFESTGFEHIIRGGYYGAEAKYMRSGYRWKYHSHSNSPGIGFRLVRTLN